MNLIMACSEDWRFALRDSSDMSWTSPGDKALFRLLTSLPPGIVGCGRDTFASMGALPERAVHVLSRSEPGRMSLPAFRHYCAAMGGGWLVGGPRLAQAAVNMGMIDQALLVMSTGVRLGDRGWGQDEMACLWRDRAQAPWERGFVVGDGIIVYRYTLRRTGHGT